MEPHDNSDAGLILEFPQLMIHFTRRLRRDTAVNIIDVGQFRQSRRSHDTQSYQCE